MYIHFKSSSIPQAKVVESSSGQLLPLGQPGELLIRGYCVMQGYWDEPHRTLESISEDGWYKTGWDFAYDRSILIIPLVTVTRSRLGRQHAWSKDLFSGTLSSDIASLNPNGYCRIEGRIKDMINRGGEKIFPAEVEQFLHTHPKVKDVQVSLLFYTTRRQQCRSYRGLAGTFFSVLSTWILQVVGVKDDRLGEQVCACIKVAEGQHCTVKEIKAYCKDQVIGMT